ncbi:hypothetical protein Dsin_002926 [Dipteronia sinensis]|uniref:Ubiquitin-like protease family profile domain-containing protein n=1 Tax=Dipteronia sinensis TaxID=43782 RepID=A0AAE0B814_9ROSI|nr:hypothetical protein Dsin_002926 [Dipteronia sinensis]
MKNGLEVFEFGEEDELAEVAASKHSAKFKNPNIDDSAALEYEFIQCVAQGTTVQKQGIGNVLCVNVDAVECDSNCDNGNMFAPPASGGEDFATQINSTSCEQLPDFEKDNFGCGSFMSELASRDSFPEAPIPGKIQLNIGISNSPSNNEPVDVNSDADESMNEGSPTSPASDTFEDGSISSNLSILIYDLNLFMDIYKSILNALTLFCCKISVSLRGHVSDNCVDDLAMDDVNMPVAICPDYVVYRGDCCSVSLVIFSCDGIKFKDLNAYGKGGTFSFERQVDDIIDIKCQRSQRIGSAVIKLRVLQEKVIEDDHARGNAGIEELKFAVLEPNWSEKQNKITSLNEKYKAFWDFEHDEDVEMEGDSSFVEKHYFHNFDEPFEDVIYPKGDSDAVSISKRDVDLLQPETFINDTIIDFYIKYLKNQIPPEEKHRIHFFNSFFFRKLADLDKDPSSISDGRAAFLRVHKWTRKVDIFGKDYIFIPVNFNLHWSLIVICHPGEVTAFKDEDMDKTEKVPCILHMDSIKGTHAGLKNLVQSYLLEEWKVRHRDASDDLSSKFLTLRFMQLELPQQENSFDCGLFLLHYLELFLAEAPVNFSPFRLTKSSNFLNGDWFLPTEASLKRTLIEKLIFELIENRSGELNSTVFDNEHQSSRLPENNQNEMAVDFLSENCRPSIAQHEINSQASQSIEITLLPATSMRNLPCVNDSGLVLREFFESGASTGSLLPQYQSFGQPSSNYDHNGTTSMREQEDGVTDEGFVYLPSGENGFPQISELTPQAGTISYSPRSFVTEAPWNPEISMQGERNADSSPEASFCTSDDSDDVGIIEHNPFAEAGQGFKDITTQQRSHSVDNLACLTDMQEDNASQGLKERSQPRSPSVDNTVCLTDLPVEDDSQGFKERTTQQGSPSADDIVCSTDPLAEDDSQGFKERTTPQGSPSADNIVCLTDPFVEDDSQGLEERTDQQRSPSGDKKLCLTGLASVSNEMLENFATEGAEGDKLLIDNENINLTSCHKNLTTSLPEPNLIENGLHTGTDMVEISLNQDSEMGENKEFTGDNDVTEGPEEGDKLQVDNENINLTLFQENLTTSLQEPNLIENGLHPGMDMAEISLNQDSEMGDNKEVTSDNYVICDDRLVDTNDEQQAEKRPVEDTNDEQQAAKRPRLTPPSEGEGLTES